MNKQFLMNELKSAREFFERSTRILDESDSSFRPTPDSMSVAEQIGHVASTIHWLLDGACSPHGFDLDFSKHAEESKKMVSVSAMRVKVEQAFERAFALLEKETEQTLSSPLPAGPVMGGQARAQAFWSISEHTSHHRGALSVY
jgi:uncharacterized damage-inducible protein DinB